MKKIFLLFLLIFAVGCENPFDKYKESFDALGVAISIGSEISKVTAIIDSLGATPNFEDLSPQDVQNLISSLDTIYNNLGNEQIDAILTSYEEQYGIDLSTQASEIQADLNGLEIVDADGDGNTANEERIVQLIGLIIGKL